MGRDDLYITVPTYFRCPISLDVMKSPVSLCTGVTYDRTSIQRWLDSGNNTCPATMQVLPSKDFVPNRTLQRLIQIWSESVRRRSDSPDSVSDVPAAQTIEQVNRLIDNLKLEKIDEKRVELLSKIVRFAKESDSGGEFLWRKEDFVPMLVDLMGNVDTKNCSEKRIELVQLAVKILDMTKSVRDRERLTNLILKGDCDCDCLTSILIVLRQGALQSKIESVRVLESNAIDSELKLVIAAKDGLLSELIKSIGIAAHPSLIEASLSCLIALSKPKSIKLKLISLKVVTELKKLITSPTDPSVSITEKALKLLETLSSCKEGRVEICEDSCCVEGIVRKVLKVSNSATEHAVTTLWSVCYLFRDQEAQEAVIRSNGVTKILLLMQSNCTPAVRQMSSDLLKVFKINSRSCLSGYDTNTTHIMPF